MAVASTTTEERVVLYGIAWSTYEAILADMDNRPIHLTYDRGALEIMSPSDEHERVKKLIARMIEAMTEERNIPIRSAGSTTFRREAKRRGLEPDECYYVANEPRLRGREDLDVKVDPPPDLAVEVEISRSALDRMGIYAALGVPEVWRYDGAVLRVETLQPDGKYVRQPQSPSFPFLPLEEFQGFLDRRNETDETSWIRSFRSWVRGIA